MSDPTPPTDGRPSPWELAVGPPPERWEDWVELDARAWPRRVEHHYRCIPTICFNCESACGLLAFVDKADGAVRKFEGNPVHPGSRGRTCAKGPATLNQVEDPERILKPLKRVGARGAGVFEPCTWEEALDDIGGRIQTALDAGRHDAVMYHVGRPGDDHFVPRLLSAWGVDGHNSHTNVCSSSTRLGMSLWCGSDRPSPDFSQAEFALLISAHLETGHYFNPHAQRIVEARERGMRLAVLDTRLSNTASQAHVWIAPWPGSEAALLLGVARELLARGAIDRDYLRRWTNWRAALAALDEGGDGSFERFLVWLSERYAAFTPEYVAEECRVPEDSVSLLADEIEKAGSRFTSHFWRSGLSGNEHGWQIARALMLLHALTGSFGVPGGLNPNAWDKCVPKPSENPPPLTRWNELIWPRQFPLAHYEMSFLLPYLQADSGQAIDVYFSRVYNPVWTNPGGASWIEMLEDEGRVGCHVALTPIWSETAQWADYVLPMGLGSERHDVMSQETHAGTWVGFRQPVGREFARLEGREPASTLGCNPGEVWEEAEFWIALTHRIDPDGRRGIRRYYESRKKPGQPIGLDEYYADLFDHGVPGLAEAAKKEGLSPLEYMRRRGAFEVPYEGQERFAREVGESEPGFEDDEGKRRAGFPTPSRRLEFFSETMRDWGFPEGEVPDYQRSHVHWSALGEDEMVLLPTFRLPTLIHTRSANSKWLTEISHTNPLWLHPQDAERLAIADGDLTRVSTRIGHFVGRAWVTEGVHPGIAACSHHVGRWRMFREIGGQKHASSLVEMTRQGRSFLFRHKEGVRPFKSDDPDSERLWWREAGVNQNLTFPPQPDRASGMHCWHQVVRVERAREGDRYGDVFVDTERSEAVYREWMEKTRPAPGPGGLRRPLWLKRPLHPAPEAYRIPEP